jgi:hypothetical protein
MSPTESLVGSTGGRHHDTQWWGQSQWKIPHRPEPGRLITLPEAGPRGSRQGVEVGRGKSPSGEEVVAEAVRDGFGAVSDTEFAKHSAGVGFDGVLGEEQFPADLAVAFALTHP